MPVFLDVHKIPQLEKIIEEIVNAPKIEFHVTHINIFFNKEADLYYCLLEASNKEGVEKHRSKINLKCDWITQAKIKKVRFYI